MAKRKILEREVVLKAMMAIAYLQGYNDGYDDREIRLFKEKARASRSKSK